MNVTHLRFFLAAVEEGGMTAAARRCFVTQPTLSAGIAALEQEIGGRLLERSRRGVSLTPLGEQVLEPARQIVHRGNALRAAGSAEPARQYLRLAAARAVPGNFLSAFIGGVLANGEIGECRILEMEPDEGGGLLARARADAVLTTRLALDARAPVRRSNKNAAEKGATKSAAQEKTRERCLVREPHGLAVPASAPFAKKKMLTLADVDGQPMIVRMHSEETRAATELLRRGHANPFVVARVTSDEWAAGLVAAGAGVCLMPESVARARLGKGAVWRRVDGVELMREIVLSWRDPIWDELFAAFSF